MKTLFTAVCLLLMVGCHNAKSQQSEGTKMPEFTFYTLKDSTAFTKSNIEPEKKCIIMLFDTSCSHCQDEVDSIGKHFSQFKGINFYMVSFDDKKSIEKFMGKYGKAMNGQRNVTVLQDSGREFIPKFQPTKFPALYVYSDKQMLIEYFAGQKEISDILAATSK